MSALAAMCRVCLAVDVRLLTIAGSLQRVYEKLTDTALHTADGRPAAACYICYAQLNKCHKLMLTSARAETLLNAILLKEIAAVNRGGIGLLGTLSVSGHRYFETQAVVIKHEPETEVPDSEIGNLRSQNMSYSGPPSAVPTEQNLHAKECRSNEDERRAQSQPADTRLDIKQEVYIKQELELEQGPPSAAAADLHDTECGSDEDDPEALSQPADTQVEIKVELELEEYVDPAQPPEVDNEQAEGSINSKQHESSGPHQCEVCQRWFKRSADLIRHYRIHKGEIPYQCEMCDSRFTLRRHYLTHVRAHTGEKPFQCNLCDSRFNLNIHLLSHMKTHTGEKPYECNVCQKRFNVSSNLRRHLRTHTGEKPFQCKVCKKAFIDSCTLSRHLRTHTGEKPFQCTVCQKTFRARFTLSKHLRLHTGESSFDG